MRIAPPRSPGRAAPTPAPARRRPRGLGAAPHLRPATAGASLRLTRRARPLLAALAAACGGEEPRLPTASELAGAYGPGAEVALNGNVVDVRVEQPASQLARGGPLWAKVGPYIFLFSPQSRDLLERYPGLGGVRVRTFSPGGEVIARALLPRDTLTGATWPRAISLAGRGRLEGTERPSYMVDLVRFGEEWTQFEYNPRYAGAEP